MELKGDCEMCHVAFIDLLPGVQNKRKTARSFVKLLFLILVKCSHFARCLAY
jgi:hypothetical protein